MSTPTSSPTTTPAPSVPVQTHTPTVTPSEYPAWWITFVVMIFLGILLFWSLKRVLKYADERRKRVQKNLNRIKKKVIASDEFMREHGYSWDWVFVFNVAEADQKPTDFQRKHSVREVVTRLCDSGLQTTMFYSVQQDEVYLKVRCHPDRVRMEADRIDFKSPLDPAGMKAVCDRGRMDSHGWAPVVYKESFSNELAPFQGLYAEYDKERAVTGEIPYEIFPEGPFRNVDRIKLIQSIIECPKRSGGAGLKIKDLTHKKACLAIYPLHDYIQLLILQSKWLSLLKMPGDQPEDEIKNYFGEKIGLYFVWLGHYTRWLMPASFVGFITWIAVAAENSNPDSPAIPYFTVFMALWATLYLESWKRKQARTARQWGMTDFEQSEQPRPEFDKVSFFRESPVTGKEEKYFPQKERYPVLFYSAVVSSTFIIGVAAAIVGIYIFRALLSNPAPRGKVSIGDFGLGSIIGSGLNAVQIMIMNVIYEKVAEYLTDRENHRTETQYEDALIAKTFSFQFVNSFMSLIYIAFIKQPLAIHGVAGEIRCYPNCFTELNSALGIIFIANIVAGNMAEVVAPIVKARIKEKKESKGMTLTSIKMTDVERQCIAEPYDQLMGTFKDYAEMIIQFGYCTLFVAAFPLATVLALLNNFIEIRVDGWKLCQVHRRPQPTGAEDIGTWYTFLELMSTLAVISNMALFAFTGEQLKDWSWKERVAFFACMEHVLLAIKYLIAELIPDTPDDVTESLEREEYLVGKVVLNIADEQDDDTTFANEMIDLSVKLTDLVPALDRGTANAAAD